MKVEWGIKKKPTEQHIMAWNALKLMDLIQS